MSKAKPQDELRPAYDLDKLGRGVTGKYARRVAAGTNLVLLEPDVAEAFPDAASVNRALRMLIDVAASSGPAKPPGAARSSRPRPSAALEKPKRGSAGRAS